MRGSPRREGTAPWSSDPDPHGATTLQYRAMARALVLHYAGQAVRGQPTKIDRSKLYGTIDVEALDEQGRPLELATLAPDGHTLIAKGGRAVAFVTSDRNWIDRARLRPVDPEGAPIDSVPSSFDDTVRLDVETNADDYLDHQVKSVYLLELDPGPPADVLVSALRAGKIFRFPFAWRAGYVADVAFLLAGQDGRPFMLVAQPTTLHFVGLEQAGAVIEDEE